METGFKLFMISALAASVVSCVVESVDASVDTSVGVETSAVTFTGYSDDDPAVSGETKTTLHTDGVSVHWGKGDKILVFSGASKGVLSEDVKLSDDPKKADFTVLTTLSDSYHAIYPFYENATYSHQTDHIVANIPTKQNAVAGSFSDGVNLAVAKSEGTNLYFKNVGAMLAVKVPSAYAGSVKIVSRNENVKMSGEATVSYNGGQPKVVASDNAVNYVELASGVNNAKDKIFNAVVYPGNYTEGFDVIVTSASAPYAKAAYSSTKPLDLKRNDNYLLFELPDGRFAWNSVAGPTSVSAVNGGWKEIAVSWKWEYVINSGDTDPRAGYIVYARKSGTTEVVKQVQIDNKETYSTTITGLDVDARYDFGVQVLKVGGGKPSEIVWAKNVWVNGNSCIPPTLKTFEQISETQVQFTWGDNTGAEKNYRIWKIELKNGSEITNTADLDANTTTYTSSVEAGHTYKFGVQAIHKESADKDSEIIYFDPYVALTWDDLLYVDMGANECLKPENVNVTLNGQQATISWESYSSAATGFNVFIREEGQKWSKDFCASKGKDDRSHTFYKTLEYGKTYYLGVQSVNAASISRNSDIVEKKVKVVEVTTELFDWEKSRTSVPTWSDMTLCYGGDLWRVPTYWDKDRFASHALYKDKSDNLHYLFDAFLALDFSMKGYTLNYDDSGNQSARKEEWSALMNYWFDETYGFQALDDCIADAAKVIGEPETKRYVVFVLPDPIYCSVYTNKSSSTKYWGTYEDGSQADFSTVDGRVKAYKWMIDNVRARFAAKDYKYIELAGFYVLQETLSASWNNQYKKWTDVLPRVADYCHNYNEGFYWIPYGYSVNKTGYEYDSGHNAAIQNWKTSFKFDLAILQPNMYWDYKEGRSWQTTCNYVNNYNMGMEIEFEGTHGEDLSTSSSILTYRKDGTVNSEAYNNRVRLRSYFENAKTNGIYGNKPLVLYSGSNAMNELANSTAEEDVIIYHELCQFILEGKH